MRHILFFVKKNEIYYEFNYNSAIFVIKLVIIAPCCLLFFPIYWRKKVSRNIFKLQSLSCFIPTLWTSLFIFNWQSSLTLLIWHSLKKVGPKFFVFRTLFTLDLKKLKSFRWKEHLNPKQFSNVNKNIKFFRFFYQMFQLITS